MIRVAYIQHGFGFGGATKSLLLMQKSVCKYVNCYTFTLPFKKDSLPIYDSFKKYNIEIRPIDIPSIYSYSDATISQNDFEERKNILPHKLIQELNKYEIDIIHINTSVFSNILPYIKANTKVKIIVHIREKLPFGPSHPIDNFIITNTLKYADRIIAISPEEAKCFVSEKTIILPNPHDFEETDNILKEPIKNKIVVGMVAGFLPYKGHLNFIDAAKIIIKEMRHTEKIEFRIIGYPKRINTFKSALKHILSFGYKKIFDRKLAESGVKSSFKIIPNTLDIYKNLSEFDIYVRPDNTGQPWGRDIIEAMALKLPVVATGIVNYFVKNGVTGFLVQPKNPKELAEKIMFLINNVALREEFGEKAYLIIKDMCDLDRFGDKINKIYEDLMK